MNPNNKYKKAEIITNGNVNLQQTVSGKPVPHTATVVNPWQVGVLKDWSITQMFHFWSDGNKKLLSVTMTKDNKHIIANGADNADIWKKLAEKANAIK